MNINKKITLTNKTILNRGIGSIKYIVIHYVGSVSSAANNANYFYSAYRGASAHYFVDEKELWQVVEDKDVSWHCGTNGTYYHPHCRNSNSIGIEMCVKNNGKWYFENKTVENTIWLVKNLMKKYNIPIANVIRHYDVTHKTCPEPYVSHSNAWKEFLSGCAGTTSVTPAPTEPIAIKTMYVKTNGGVLMIRNNPSTSATAVGSKANGSRVSVYEEKKDWARVGVNQWMSSQYLTTTEPKKPSATHKAYVKVSSSLNVRTGPGTNYKVIKSLKNGTEVTIHEKNNGWARVGSGEWVSSDHLVVTSSSSSTTTTSKNKTMVVNATSGVNKRNGPGTGYKIVGSYKNGTKVKIYSISKGWAKVDGGYVSATYLK